MDGREACGRLAQSVQRFFPCFESLLAKNEAAPFAVGASLTIADVLLAELVHSTVEAFEATSGFGQQAVDALLVDFPRLRAIEQHVLALPTIVAFMASPNCMPFPAGDVGKAYVRNVRTVLA